MLSAPRTPVCGFCAELRINSATRVFESVFVKSEIMNPCKDAHEFLTRYGIKFDPSISQQSITIPTDLSVDNSDMDFYNSLMSQQPKKIKLQFTRL
jgi:hypothetical protein